MQGNLCSTSKGPQAMPGETRAGHHVRLHVDASVNRSGIAAMTTRCMNAQLGRVSLDCALCLSQAWSADCDAKKKIPALD